MSVKSIQTSPIVLLVIHLICQLQVVYLVCLLLFAHLVVVMVIGKVEGFDFEEVVVVVGRLRVRFE